MLRILAFCSMALSLPLMWSAQARAEGTRVSTDIPPSIESCLKTGLGGLLNINRADQKSLFEYFLTHIDMEKFGHYNYKRAWTEWAGNPEIQRLAVYEYFRLIANNRGKHKGDTTSFDARLADRPVVSGEGIYHVIANVNFAAGSSTTIVVLSSGCKVFGFMYAGANLRSFVNADVVENAYRSGKRAPF